MLRAPLGFGLRGGILFGGARCGDWLAVRLPTGLEITNRFVLASAFLRDKGNPKCALRVGRLAACTRSLRTMGEAPKHQL